MTTDNEPISRPADSSARFEVRLDDEAGYPVVRLADHHAGSTATIAVARGFNLFSWQTRGPSGPIEQLDTRPDFLAGGGRASHSGIPLLAPFPNRIGGAEYTWLDQSYSLPRNETNGRNAIHGLVLDSSWSIDDRDHTDSASVSATIVVDHAGWPGRFGLRARYQLCDNQLTFTLEAWSEAAVAMPMGFGVHPYFRHPAGGPSIDDCDIALSALTGVELVDCLPTGRLTTLAAIGLPTVTGPIGSQSFDHVLTGLAPLGPEGICHRLLDRATGRFLEVAHGPEWPFLVVYTPAHRASVCFEPYTCVTDAVRLASRVDWNTGLWSLPPGGRMTARLVYRVGTLPLGDS